MGWSGSNLTEGLAGPERVSPSPVLLQSLGRTSTDSHFWTLEGHP